MYPKIREGLVGLIGGITAAIMPVSIDVTVNHAHAQSAAIRDHGPCVYEGKSYDFCVDQVYQRAASADNIYPGAKRTSGTGLLVSRQKYLSFKPGEWEKYFFNSGDLSNSLQRIFQEDGQVDYARLFNLLNSNKGRIDKVLLFREGYMSIGIIDNQREAQTYIIPISPITVERVKAL